MLDTDSTFETIKNEYNECRETYNNLLKNKLIGLLRNNISIVINNN